MVLASIRKISGKKKLQKIKSSKPKPVPFHQISTVGILYYLDDDSNLKHLKKILQQPFLQNKKVETICWLKSSKKKPHPQLEGVQFVERADFDTNFLPSAKTTRYFCEQEFDLLLDLTADYHFPIHAISVMSNAKMKTGRDHKLNWHLQLKIKLSESKRNQTLYLFDQIIFYLEQILE
jgi:hypothetical protein